MRSKLARFGFQENQIQAMMHPEKQIPLPKTTHETKQPTFVKVNRKHLDVETLIYYDIPYEFDKDPDYIIVRMIRHLQNIQSHRCRSRVPSRSCDMTHFLRWKMITGQLLETKLTIFVHISSFDAASYTFLHSCKSRSI
jgi:hypothetical protein